MELHDFLEQIDEMSKPLIKSKNFRIQQQGEGWVRLMSMYSGRSIDIAEKNIPDLIELLKKVK
jgi:hypothetical protein